MEKENTLDVTVMTISELTELNDKLEGEYNTHKFMLSEKYKAFNEEIKSITEDMLALAEQHEMITAEINKRNGRV